MCNELQSNVIKSIAIKCDHNSSISQLKQQSRVRQEEIEHVSDMNPDTVKKNGGPDAS